MLDSRSLRRRLDEVLRTDAELDAYCLDFFPEVHRRFGSQMERTQKINLLFQLVPDHREILHRLRGEQRNPAVMRRWGVLILISAAAALLITSLLSSGPRKMETPVQPRLSEKPSAAPTLWRVAGLVRDARGEPLPDVTVSLPELAATTRTNEYGAFHLEVPAEQGGLVLLRADKPPAAPNAKPRYRPREIHVDLGSTRLDFSLEDAR